MTFKSGAGCRLRVPDDYAQEYLRRSAGTKLAPRTVQTYDSQLTEYVTYLHDQEASVLSGEFADVIEFAEDCVHRGNRQSTIESKLSTVGELYRYIRLRTDAADELCLDPLRFRDIDVSQYNVPETIEREALSREEIRRLFDAFDSYRNRLLAVVGIETGLRNSDLRGLRIEDIEFEKLEIHVPEPKNSRPYDVPISEDIGFELDFWQRHHRGGYSSAAASPFVFPSRQGEKLKRNGSLNKIVREAAERAGIQDVIGQSRVTPAQQKALGTKKEYREWHRVTPHTLRHSCITLLKDSGVELSYRQLIANHTKPETTLGYTHGRNDVFDAVRSRFNPPR